MSPFLTAAAALAVLLVAAHSYLGERYILVRLFRREDLPKLFGGTRFTKETLRFAWHITSVMGLGFAWLLLLLASGRDVSTMDIARVIAATFGACGVLALVGSRGRHLSWIAFFGIAALVFGASR
jgi:hypothetical protein